MRRFETRLDVALCRIGWCYNLEQARSWITEGRIFINENVKKKVVNPASHGARATTKPENGFLKSKVLTAHPRSRARAPVDPGP